ncbi:MAG: hypothetical protein KDE56_18565 [Anaerolineales bacterium]|nr:hypothetical protein [Anaerolineales bacterium]
MKKTNTNTPKDINYQVQAAIEQMVATLPKGTDLGLCDVISAMFSGYFVESGGSIMPAVDQYLNAYVRQEPERAARSRRAAKAITYGQYNLEELLGALKEIVAAHGYWKPTVVQGYQLKPVDMTAYKRSSVKAVKSKTYDSGAGKAVAGVPFGIMGTTGRVGEQRLAILEVLVCGDTSQNAPAAEMEKVYKQVAKRVAATDLALFDAGFSLVDAVRHGIHNSVVRLAKNCTFGKTPGKIPLRTSHQGRCPSRHQAEVIRPLARQHGDNLLTKTEPTETHTVMDEAAVPIVLEVWAPVYFLERQLDRVENDAFKRRLRQLPLKVIAIHHPNFDDPLLLGTPVLALTAQSLPLIYPQRWPIEGIPQTAKFILSGGGGRHYVHHPTAITRLPALTLIFGSLLKYLAAILPPIRSGFWDRAAKPTYGRLLRYLKKVGLPLSSQLSKKASVTAHLPLGYEAIRLARA